MGSIERVMGVSRGILRLNLNDMRSGIIRTISLVDYDGSNNECLSPQVYNQQRILRHKMVLKLTIFDQLSVHQCLIANSDQLKCFISSLNLTGNFSYIVEEQRTTSPQSDPVQRYAMIQEDLITFFKYSILSNPHQMLISNVYIIRDFSSEEVLSLNPLSTQPKPLQLTQCESTFELNLHPSPPKPIQPSPQIQNFETKKLSTSSFTHLKQSQATQKMVFKRNIKIVSEKPDIVSSGQLVK